MRRQKRGSLYLITGFVIGAGLGLLYAWAVRPVQYVNISPASLSAPIKDRYRVLIAAAYAADGNLGRARARLELLKDPDPLSALTEQAQRWLVDGSQPQEAQALGMLSVALGQPNAPNTPPPAVPTPLPSPTAPSETSPPDAPPIEAPVEGTPTDLPPSPTPTQAPTQGPTQTPNPQPTETQRPTPTQTAPPTRTPTPTLEAPFALEERLEICDANLPEPVVQVIARDSSGEQLPGVEVIVVWEGGEQHFFTGLKPELGAGFADFTLVPGVTYSLRLAQGGQPVSDLQALECRRRAGQPVWGAWRLVFQQP